MKKVKKLFFSLALVFGLTFMAPTIAGVRSIARASVTPSAYYIQVENFEAEAAVGTEYIIKAGKVLNLGDDSLVDDAEVKVFNPYGQLVTVADGKFNVAHFGQYRVEYSYGTTSYTLKVLAQEGRYSFDFEENSKQIIPSVMNISYAGNVVLPNPTIKDEDGEEIEGANVEVKVIKPDFSLATLTTVDGFKEVKVDVTGVWTVKYEYKVDGRVLASTTKEIKANSTHNNTYNLTFTRSSTPPSTAITKVETLLPSVNAKDPSENAVAVSLTIKAEKIVYTNGVPTGKTDVTTATIDGRNFTAQEDGDYFITYTVEDFFGNSKVEGFYINGVKDTKAPEVKIVETYETAPVDLTDLSYKIPTKANLNNFVLPAIWAEDNVSTSLETLELTRIIKRYGETIYTTKETPNKELVFNKTEDYTLGADQELATLPEGVNLTAGTYTITYIAKDEAKNESVSMNYTVTLESGFIDTTAPEITWSKTEVLPTRIRLGNKITFAAPTVKDEVQTRHNLVVEYAYFDGADLTDWTALELNDLGLYEIEVEDKDEVGYTEVRIRATAKDAYNAITVDAPAIEIIDTTDNQALSISAFTEVAVQNFKQGEEINLGELVLEDDLIEYVSTSIFASVNVDGRQQSIVVYDAEVDKSGNTMTISNAKMLAAFDGTYTITYVAKDIKNNYVVYSYEIEIAAFDQQIDIDFTGLPTILNVNGKLELGGKITLPEAKIVAPNSAIYSGYTVSVVSGPAAYTINNDEFHPEAVGTYKIRYRALVDYDGSTETITRDFTVEVSDTTAPVISNIELEEKVNLNYELTIPMVSAIDNNGYGEINWAESKVVIKRKLNNSSSTVKEIYLNLLEEDTKVVLSYNQVYTLTYTVKDIHGNTATLEKTIKVGDTDSPVITIDESSKVFVPTTAKLGSRLYFNLDKVTVEDLTDTDLSKNDIVVKLTRDGETIANLHGEDSSVYEFELSAAGQYTLTLKVTDAAGNESQTITRTITVSADENKGIETTQVIGVVLVVVSALILAGAIVYVILSKKKADKYNR